MNNSNDTESSDAFCALARCSSIKTNHHKKLNRDRMKSKKRSKKEVGSQLKAGDAK